jgi:hypothetical protein
VAISPDIDRPWPPVIGHLMRLARACREFGVSGTATSDAWAVAVKEGAAMSFERALIYARSEQHG